MAEQQVLADMQARLSELGTIVQNMGTTVLQMMDRLNQQPATSAAPLKPHFKLKLPEKFDGRRRDEYAQGWLYSTDKYVLGMFLTDLEANALMSNLLIDDALTWFRMTELMLERSNAERVERGEAPERWSWTAFKTKFEAHYVSPLLKEKARRALKDIKMVKSVSGYNAQFNTLLV